ncbi:MAG: AsmA family protein [Alphaproteobacteria bacterium]|nr:AsmA family protein [Alphaproteobacteria bacterium]
MSVSEHAGKNRMKAGWNNARARVVADFRDFRFTWGGFFKWTGITLLAFLVAAIITLYFLDWNQMRGPIGRYLSNRTGREVRIDGNLSVKLFSWQPSVDVGQVFIGNPGWVGTPQAAKFTHARVEARLVPLIFGDVILPLVRIDEPELLVVRDADGHTNWDSKGGQNPNEAFKLPPIRRFIVNNGHVEIRDAVRKLHFTGTVSSTEEAGSKRASFALTGDGTLNKNKFLANVQGGPLLNVDESKPYNFTADVHAGDTHAVVNGAITQPFHLDRFTASINVSGPDLSDLYFLTGLVLPKTPTYHMTVAVQREGSFYRLTDINAMLGSTDLAGNLTVDASNKVPALAGKVASRSLNFADLGPMIGGGKAQPVASTHLLPDTALHTERLKQTNAEVDYSAASIKSQDFPLTSLDAHISVKDAVLNLKPLSFGFTHGKLSGSLKVDARKEVPVTSVDARLTDLKAESFIKGTDKPIQGTLEARAVLTGSGNSVHKVASTANGTFTAVVPQGGMRHSLAEWLGIDVLKALSLNLGDDNSNTQLRCAVAGFGVKNGLMTSQTFVLDTEPVRVDGSGKINLADETLDLRLQGAPKHFQIVRLRAPITVKGSLAHPAIGVDAGQAIAQGGIALALGFINPLAAVLAFVDPGLAKDANCGPLLADAKAKGAPVKASAVRNAPAPRK